MKHYFLLFISISIFILFLLYPQKHILIFPNNKVSIRKVEDHFDSGNSFVDSLNNSTELKFNIHLRKGFKYPYAGVCIGLDKKIDLSKYDSISILSETNPKLYLTFTLRDYNKNISNPINPHSYTYSEIMLFPKKLNEFALKNLKIPLWWNKEHKKRLNFTKNAIKNIEFIEITNSIIDSKDSNFSVKIKQIKATGESQKSYILLIMSISILFINAIFLLRTKYKKKKYKINIEKNHIKIKPDNAYERILSCIYKQYTNPELSINTISKTVGMNRPKVSAIIKKHTNKNFKSLLNEIRLEESARLLSKTDNQISEIAYNVGYNSISHFNRVFKDKYKKSPKEYRKKHS